MSENDPVDSLQAARAARMAKFSIAQSSVAARPISERAIKGEGRGSVETRTLFVAWTTFRGHYPRIDDTMLAATWTALNPKGSRTDTYKAKSIGSTVSSLNLDGKMSTFFTLMADTPEAFFEKLSQQYGKPIDPEHTKPLIAAAKAAWAARSTASAQGKGIG